MNTPNVADPQGDCNVKRFLSDGDEPRVFEALRDPAALERVRQKILAMVEMTPDQLKRLETRVLAGRPTYGVLDLAADRRDWNSEAECELLDLFFYVACAVLTER